MPRKNLPPHSAPSLAFIIELEYQNTVVLSEALQLAACEHSGGAVIDIKDQRLHIGRHDGFRKLVCGGARAEDFRVLLYAVDQRTAEVFCFSAKEASCVDDTELSELEEYLEEEEMNALAHRGAHEGSSAMSASASSGITMRMFNATFSVVAFGDVTFSRVIPSEMLCISKISLDAQRIPSAAQVHEGSSAAVSRVHSVVPAEPDPYDLYLTGLNVHFLLSAKSRNSASARRGSVTPMPLTPPDVADLVTTFWCLSTGSLTHNRSWEVGGGDNDENGADTEAVTSVVVASDAASARSNAAGLSLGAATAGGAATSRAAVRAGVP